MLTGGVKVAQNLPIILVVVSKREIFQRESHGSNMYYLLALDSIQPLFGLEKFNQS